jgi:hypothetical protein
LQSTAWVFTCEVKLKIEGSVNCEATVKLLVRITPVA